MLCRQHIKWYYDVNKRPKGSHIVHLSTICHLLEESARAAILCLLIRLKNTHLVEDVDILLSVKFRWILFSGFRGEVENVYAIRGQGGHLVFPIGQKNKTLVEDVEILLLVKFRWIPFSDFKGEVENGTANQRQWWPSCFHYWPDKHKLSRGLWNLASCQVSLNSVQWFSEEKTKMSQPIRGHSGHLVFLISLKNTKLVEDVEILLPVKFRWIQFSGFRGEVGSVSANQRPGQPSCFTDRHKKHKLGRGCWDLASFQVLLNSVQRFQRRSRKCEKLTTDGTITKVHLSLRLRCTKKRAKGPQSCRCYRVYLILEWNTPIGPKKCKYGRGRQD